MVKSFDNWDVYYLNEYAHSFMIHGDGQPLLFEYKDETTHFCIVAMKSDIADFRAFEGYLEKEKYYDMETPYGYGGPLCDAGISVESQNHFKTEMQDYCRGAGIVSMFVRFHPLINNFDLLPDVIETRYMRDTIFMDTSSPEIIMSNMDSKNRNMVRKAIKSGIIIEQHDISEYALFKGIYEETMDKDSADPYFYFSDDYYRSLEEMSDNTCIFLAMAEGEPVAGTIIYYNNEFAHYHLAGTRTEFRKYAPGNLMLYEIACRASKKGIKKFHLGGGMTADDNLFRFKKQFNKTGRLPFFVGRTIFDQEEYDNLLILRKKHEPDFDINNSRIIQYRY